MNQVQSPEGLVDMVVVGQNAIFHHESVSKIADIQAHNNLLRCDT